MLLWSLHKKAINCNPNSHQYVFKLWTKSTTFAEYCTLVFSDTEVTTPQGETPLIFKLKNWDSSKWKNLWEHFPHPIKMVKGILSNEDFLDLKVFFQRHSSLEIRIFLIAQSLISFFYLKIRGWWIRNSFNSRWELKMKLTYTIFFAWTRWSQMQLTYFTIDMMAQNAFSKRNVLIWLLSLVIMPRGKRKKGIMFPIKTGEFHSGWLNFWSTFHLSHPPHFSHIVSRTSRRKLIVNKVFFYTVLS